MPPVKNPCDFLRRHYPHQVIGSKFGYFLSACVYKLPCIYFVYDCTPFSVEIQGVFLGSLTLHVKAQLSISLNWALFIKHSVVLYSFIRYGLTPAWRHNNL